ncbi:MAG: orotate phosphoribosyltransferase, partial [Flavobacteriales bacterium CG_4_10_14_0_2_um_filter_35_18]
MQLESPKVSVKKSANQLFDFLTEVSNFESIMPENIDKFEALDQSFIFALKGMPSIKLKLGSLEKPTKIVLVSASDKFPFSLTADIVELDSA